MKLFLVAAVATTLSLATAVTPSMASGSTVPEHGTVDPAIVEMLDAIPGGVVVTETHAVWPEIGMDMVVQPVSSTETGRARALAAVGACPSGRVCAFDSAATAGSRLSWTTCDTSFPVGTFVVRSLADARSSGHAQAKYGTTVRATAYAGGFTNVYGSVARVTCVS